MENILVFDSSGKLAWIEFSDGNKSENFHCKEAAFRAITMFAYEKKIGIVDFTTMRDKIINKYEFAWSNDHQADIGAPLLFKENVDGYKFLSQVIDYMRYVHDVIDIFGVEIFRTQIPQAMFGYSAENENGMIIYKENADGTIFASGIFTSKRQAKLALGVVMENDQYDIGKKRAMEILEQIDASNLEE